VNQVAFGLAGLVGAFVGALAVLVFRALRQPRQEQVDDDPLQAAFHQSPSGMLLVDAGTLKVIAANPASQGSLGYTPVELGELTLTQLFADDSGDGVEMTRRLRDPNPRMPARLHQRCKDGSLQKVEVSGHALTIGGRQALCFTVNDISLRSKVEAQLLEKQQHLDHLAHHDQLTGLPNRLFLAADLPGAIEEARVARQMLAVLFLDLDRFKHINDSRGHETGDKLLKTVAQRIRETMRAEDMVVRMGGDEFIVVLKNV
jgi:PAS domain S-box-containing protein